MFLWVGKKPKNPDQNSIQTLGNSTQETWSQIFFYWYTGITQIYDHTQSCNCSNHDTIECASTETPNEVIFITWSMSKLHSIMSNQHSIPSFISGGKIDEHINPEHINRKGKRHKLPDLLGNIWYNNKRDVLYASTNSKINKYIFKK